MKRPRGTRSRSAHERDRREWWRTECRHDPEELHKFIGDAEEAADDVDDFIDAYRSRFVSNGVSTTNIDKVGQASEWLRDQLPMLRRRHGMAKIAAEQSGTSFVAAGAGELKFETSEEAKKQAEEDAARLLDGVKPGDDIPPEVYELLNEHSDDPDYVEAFYNKIGADGINALRIGAQAEDGGPGEYDKSKLVPLSYSMATASYRIDFSEEKWLQGMNGVDPSYHGTTVAVLSYGKFNGNFLSAAMDRLESSPAAPSPEDTEAIFNAMARNPVAAAEWYKNNKEKADIYLQGRSHLMRDGVPEAFNRIMEAATIDVRRYDQELGEQNTHDLLERVSTKWGDWGPSRRSPEILRHADRARHRRRLRQRHDARVGLLQRATQRARRRRGTGGMVGQGERARHEGPGRRRDVVAGVREEIPRRA